MRRCSPFDFTGGFVQSDIMTPRPRLQQNTTRETSQSGSESDSTHESHRSVSPQRDEASTSATGDSQSRKGKKKVARSNQQSGGPAKAMWGTDPNSGLRLPKFLWITDELKRKQKARDHTKFGDYKAESWEASEEEEIGVETDPYESVPYIPQWAQEERVKGTGRTLRPHLGLTRAQLLVVPTSGCYYNRRFWIAYITASRRTKSKPGQVSGRGRRPHTIPG